MAKARTLEIDLDASQLMEKLEAAERQLFRILVLELERRMTELETIVADALDEMATTVQNFTTQNFITYDPAAPRQDVMYTTVRKDEPEYGSNDEADVCDCESCRCR